MSLVLSPQLCQMSTTTSTRTTPGIEPVHVSPRLRPPPQTYHIGSRSSPRRLSPTTSKQSTSKSESLIDPFLEQYIKPSSNDHHELYFRSLNRQVRIKSFDYYQQYLNHSQTDKSTPNIDLFKQSLVKRNRKPPSPLLKEIELDDDDQIVSEDDFEDEQPTSRRRRHTGSDTPTAEVSFKKSHPQVVTKSLPPEFMNCAIEDLISLISRMLHSLISLNDRSVPLAVSNPTKSDANSNLTAEQKKKLLTRYHSRTPPAISIETYIGRLTKFNNFTQATLLTTIYYIDLLSHNFQPYFTLNSWTVHRFLLVATMLAQKSLEDFFYTNDHYAKVGGVALTELNCLELDFLNRVDWKLVPAKQLLNNKTSIRYYREVLDLYYKQLVTLMGCNVSENNKVIYSLDEGSLQEANRPDASHL